MTPLPASPFLNPDALSPCASEAAASSAPQSSAAAINPGPTIPYGPNLPAASQTSQDAAGLLETDCISEIFFYARKLMKEPVGFILDEQAFMAEIEEAPLFLRQAG